MTDRSSAARYVSRELFRRLGGQSNHRVALDELRTARRVERRVVVQRNPVPRRVWLLASHASSSRSQALGVETPPLTGVTRMTQLSSGSKNTCSLLKEYAVRRELVITMLTVGHSHSRSQHVQATQHGLDRDRHQHRAR